MCETIIECIDKFAAEKKLSLIMERTRGLPTKLKTQWSNEIASSENGLKIQTLKNHFEYKNQGNVVTQKIRLAKKESNFKKLGPNPSPKHIYRTLKLQQMQQYCTILRDLDHLNNYYVSVGQIVIQVTYN